ncbi:hypothetical protein ABEB36_014988 [Hypothenemus hampei]|uniref:Uncharacterized protein n=1 Tax=Hypothenemus hampei TaxID=57062 RepID=A0ABD1E3K0_HYPHA
MRYFIFIQLWLRSQFVYEFQADACEDGSVRYLTDHYVQIFLDHPYDVAFLRVITRSVHTHENVRLDTAGDSTGVRVTSLFYNYLVSAPGEQFKHIGTDSAMKPGFSVWITGDLSAIFAAFPSEDWLRQCVRFPYHWVMRLFAL